MSNKVIYLPTSPTNMTSKVDGFFSGLKVGCLKIIQKIGLPGIMKNTEIHDSVTGQIISVRTTDLFTILSVNGRDYYFHRLTGKFDGTGSRAF